MTEVIHKVGTDSSGRAIYMTAHMRRVWALILAHPKVAPFADKLVIVQGAFMVRNGGGATASSGYHDGGGCLDVRTWNLSGSELETFIRVARRHGFAFWRRDKFHGGMDPHAHGVLGSDSDLSAGAQRQWQAYLNGRDGLASNGPDYEWRPDPLVTAPPKPTPTIDHAIDDLKKARDARDPGTPERKALNEAITAAKEARKEAQS